MAVIKPELKAILDRYGIDPRDQSQIWDCRGTLVLYHKAYEIIAAKEAISFDPPTVIRCDKTEAVIMVVGQMGERREWSFGEAVIGQNYQVSGKQAAYPWAMAEKRAKDRVIAKLVGLAAYVLSEDEADHLSEGKGEQPRPQQREQTPNRSGGATDGERAAAATIRMGLDMAETLDDLAAFWKEHSKHVKELPPALADELTKAKDARKAALTVPANAAE